MMDTPNARRAFIKKSALTLAATSASFILPRSVFGQTSASNRLNIAIIGCGDRMNGLLGELLRIDAVCVIAAVDPFQDRREAKAERCNTTYGGEYCVPIEDFREVMANPDIDGVVVATPDHWHVPIAIAAARAGKDMYVEKPLGLSMDRAGILRDEIQRNQCVFQYGTQQHSSASGRQAMELVWNGYIGKIDRVDLWSPALDASVVGPISTDPIPDNLNYDLWLGPAKQAAYSNARVDNMSAWHCYDYALGFIAGWGAHPIDIMQWGLRTEDTAPVNYQGSGYLPQQPDLYDTIRTWDVNMEYADGTTARFMDKSTAQPLIKAFHPYFKDNGVIFHGSEGYVCHSRGACYLFHKGKYVNLGKVDFDSLSQRAFVSRGHMANFVDCMKSRAKTVNPIDSAINGDSVSHLANVAIRTGRKLRYDPATLSILGDPEAHAQLTRPMRAPYQN